MEHQTLHFHFSTEFEKEWFIFGKTARTHRYRHSDAIELNERHQSLSNYLRTICVYETSTVARYEATNK